MKFKSLLLQILLFPVLPILSKGPDPSEFNKPTPQEGAQTEVATRMFNLALEGKPVTDAYQADITRDPSLTANQVQGQAAVDLAKKAPQSYVDPTRGMNTTAATGMAGARSAAMNNIAQDATSQKAAGMKSIVENALGQQSTANTAMTGMAADAVDRSVNAAQSSYNNKASTMSSLSTLAGAGAVIARDKFLKSGANT